MADLINQVLKEKKIGYAVFDPDLILAISSPNFNKIINIETPIKSLPIWEIFPELIGCEDAIAAIQNKGQRRYELKKLSRLLPNENFHYYDLTILPIAASKQLLCVVADTTEETALMQHIQQQRNEIELLQANLSSYGQFQSRDILGESPKIQQVRGLISKIAQIRNTTILLQGESGTGKNLVARTIHRNSMLPQSPFVEINCASIPSTLLESEIFGHEKGAFTHAIMSKKGLLEEADGGTLFLDEIGELPLSLQAKFLSFLETKTFRRLGSTQERNVNIRVIAATNKDLKKAVEDGEFRQDLFYRINVVSIELPPLREMENDIIAIADHFTHIFAFDFRKNVKSLSEGARKKLTKYPWPGNIRELRNVIERAVIFAENDKISENEILLTEEFSSPPTPENGFVIPDDGISFSEVEQQLLVNALTKADGNQSKAAKLLKLSLDTFRYRMKKYGLMT